MSKSLHRRIKVQLEDKTHEELIDRVYRLEWKIERLESWYRVTHNKEIEWDKIIGWKGKNE